MTKDQIRAVAEDLAYMADPDDYDQAVKDIESALKQVASTSFQQGHDEAIEELWTFEEVKAEVESAHQMAWNEAIEKAVTVSDGHKCTARCDDQGFGPMCVFEVAEELCALKLSAKEKQ